MSRLGLRTVFHGAAVLHHSYAIWTSSRISSKKYDDPVISVAITYGPIYLTYWNLTYQLVFMVLSLRCDIAEWTSQKISGTWVRLRERIFHSLVFPFTVYVTTVFWALYALDRELVYPLIFDTVIPIWLNHSVHTVIILVLAAEMLLQPRTYFEDGPYYKIFIVATFLYPTVYHTTHLVDGVWLYPFYYLMSWPLIGLWFMKYVAFLHFLYHIQWPLLQYTYKKEEERPDGVNSQCNNQVNDFGERNGKFVDRAKVL